MGHVNQHAVAIARQPFDVFVHTVIVDIEANGRAAAVSVAISGGGARYINLAVAGQIECDWGIRVGRIVQDIHVFNRRRHGLAPDLGHLQRKAFVAFHWQTAEILVHPVDGRFTQTFHCERLRCVGPCRNQYLERLARNFSPSCVQHPEVIGQLVNPDVCVGVHIALGVRTS